jgi:hypothetical protein
MDQKTVNNPQKISKPKNPKFVVELLPTEEISISTTWDSNVKADTFGGMLALLNNGFFNDFIMDSVIKYGERKKSQDVATKILDAYGASNQQILQKSREIVYASDQEDVKRQIIWEAYDDNDEVIDTSSLDEETNEESEGSGIYGIPNFPGLMNANQFNNLKKTIINSLPKMPDREFWWAYTNFSLTDQNLWKLITSTPGIEMATLGGRYTFLIGIGKAFNFPFVRKLINKRLLDEASNE